MDYLYLAIPFSVLAVVIAILFKSKPKPYRTLKGICINDHLHVRTRGSLAQASQISSGMPAREPSAAESRHLRVHLRPSSQGLAVRNPCRAAHHPAVLHLAVRMN